jgi:dTMP kinase
MFIALEGIDGTGKTTISRRVAEMLLGDGLKVYLTREPTDNLVLDHEKQSDRSPGNAISLFFRFTEDRFSHQEVIKEKLREGYLAITDRYILSSFAYQGSLIEPIFGDKGKTIEWMSSVSEVIDLVPDLTFYLDLGVEEAMQRMGNRSRLTGFEEKKYLADVKSYYEHFIDGKVVRIDASRSIAEVADDVYSRIVKKLD